MAVDASPVADLNFEATKFNPMAQLAGVGARTALTQAATRTLTAAQIVNGHLVYTGATTEAATLPTAALLVAAIANLSGVVGPLPQIGTVFNLYVTNSGSNTVTITAGTGCTLTGTGAVATAKAQIFRCILTGVASGSEAFQVDNVFAAAL